MPCLKKELPDVVEITRNECAAFLKSSSIAHRLKKG